MTTDTVLRDYNVEDLSNSSVMEAGTVKVNGVEKQRKKSIDELLKQEKSEGYSNMTDEEIARIIDYKTRTAEANEYIRTTNEHNQQMLETMIQNAQESKERSAKFFQEIINRKPARIIVDFSEVNNNGQETLL